MKKKMILLSLACILFLGFFLRNHNLTRWPREGATFDEYAWTFLGVSIINTGVPTSWSPHEAYKDKVQYINPNGTSFFLSTPYLEHPPLFGIVAGLFAKYQGVHSFDDVTIECIRPLALFLGVLSIAMVFLLASRFYDGKTGLISAFVYALMPTVVAGSRIVQNENFFIPLFLLTLFLGRMFTETKKKKYLVFSVILSSLLLLAKMPWIAAGGALCMMFVYKKQYKAALWTVLGAVVALLLFFGYGFYFDREVFLNLWKLQLARYDMTFTSIFTIITDPIVTDRLFLDGWLYFGWIAIALLATETIKKHWGMLFGFIAYLGVYLLAIPSEPGHGWYRYPLYPFMAIAIGYFLTRYFNKNSILTCLFLLVTGLSMLHHTWLPCFGFSYWLYRSFTLWCLISGFSFIFHARWAENFSKWSNRILFLFIILLTLWAGFGYNEQ